MNMRIFASRWASMAVMLPRTVPMSFCLMVICLPLSMGSSKAEFCLKTSKSLGALHCLPSLTSCWWAPCLSSSTFFASAQSSPWLPLIYWLTIFHQLLLPMKILKVMLWIEILRRLESLKSFNLGKFGFRFRFQFSDCYLLNKMLILSILFYGLLRFLCNFKLF